MAGLANVEINIFSLIVLIILFVNMYRRNGEYLIDQKFFFYMLAADALLLILDSMQWILDGIPGVVPHNINLISNMIYYIVQMFPGVLWCLYVRYQMTMDGKQMVKAVKFLIVPFIINTVMSVLSSFYGYFYYIDNDNFYHRGEYFWVFLIIVYSCIAYALIYIIINRRKTEKKIFYSLLFFFLPPMVGSLIQIFNYGTSLIWSGAALGLLILYINIQKNQLYTDHLTGLYNRRLLDIHLDGCLKKGGGRGGIGVIMLDIDEFKSINDAHGHITGDQALIITAGILKKSVGKSGFIARYGGDEFVVVVSAKSAFDIESIVKVIERNFGLYNEREDVPYKIKLSMGYDVFKCGGTVSTDDVLNSIDHHMYENKLKCRT